MIGKFLIFWSLISPVCIGLIACFLGLSQTTWYPSHPDIGVSIIIYLAYWLLLGSLQGVLLFRLQHPSLARRWFLATTLTGFLLMLAHEIALLGVNTTGQGILFLLISLPCLAILGGPILGFVQFLLLRNINTPNPKENYLHRTWFMASFASWFLGFLSIFGGNYTFLVLLLLAAIGTLIKGLFVARYLQI